MYNKTSILTCGKSLVGFRSDDSAIYASLYNVAQATVGNQFTFNAAAKTITRASGSFITDEFEVGDEITITNTTNNNVTRTISVITALVITVTESLVNETSSTATVTGNHNLQDSESQLYVNDLPGVSFENVNANLSADAASAKTYLKNVYESEFLAIVNRFVLSSKQNYNSKELLSKHSIVSGVASMNDKVTQNARFVGYMLRPHRSNYLNIEITHLGFQSTVLQNDLKIYLYETSQLEPIATFEIDITKQYSLQWTEISNAILRYQSETGGTGQVYLLGYYEQDPDNEQSYQLQGQAIYLDFDCGCAGSPKEKYGKYVDIQPIEIPNDKLNYDEDESEYFIPLVDDVTDFVTDNTHGLNAKINVTCDITDVLCHNIEIFAPALQHAIASRILYDNYASNRMNSVADSKREQAKQFAMKYDGILNGYNTPEGIRIKGLVDTLTVDFSALDSYCLPCKPGLTKGNLVR